MAGCGRIKINVPITGGQMGDTAHDCLGMVWLTKRIVLCRLICSAINLGTIR